MSLSLCGKLCSETNWVYNKTVQPFGHVHVHVHISLIGVAVTVVTATVLLLFV